MARADAEDWAGAEAAFAAVCEVAPTPNAVFNLAVARFHQGKATAAVQALDLLATLPGVTDADAETARVMREELESAAAKGLQPPDAPGGAQTHQAAVPAVAGDAGAWYGARPDNVAAPSASKRPQEALSLSSPPVEEPSEQGTAGTRRRRRWLWSVSAVLLGGAAMAVGLSLRGGQSGVGSCIPGSTSVSIGGC